MAAPADRQIFVAYPWALYEDREAYKRAYTSMERALKVKFIFAEQRVSSGTVLQKIEEMIDAAAFGIYDVSSWNANVTLEYGYARGRGAQAFIAFNPTKTDLGDVPSDVKGWDRLQYSDLDELQSAVEDLVVQVIGTGASSVDQLELDRRELLRIVKENPGKTRRQLAQLSDWDTDYIGLLIGRSVDDLIWSGATQATKYSLAD